MLGPFDYLLRHPPPYPGFGITVSWGNRQVSLWAQIDTGADCTYIPDWLVGRLHLTQINDSVNVNRPGMPTEQFWLYAANLEFKELSFKGHPVVPFPWPEVLIGLDLINEWVLTLDGPNRQFFIDK